jgi:hypothetical protein
MELAVVKDPVARRNNLVCTGKIDVDALIRALVTIRG